MSLIVLQQILSISSVLVPQPTLEGLHFFTFCFSLLEECSLCFFWLIILCYWFSINLLSLFCLYNFWHDLFRYYYNKKTKLSTWEKPLELMTPIEVSHLWMLAFHLISSCLCISVIFLQIAEIRLSNVLVSKDAFAALFQIQFFWHVLDI